METLTEAQDDSSGANPSSVKSDDSSPRHGGGRGSPPPNCAICLGTCRNKSFTDSCLHQFCFKCLLTWSRVKAECPLCKQNFRSIIHNVRSNHQYEEYLVEQRHTEETTERIDIDSLTNTRRFRYRTTLTLPRRETLAIQQLLLHYPMVADVFPPPAARAPPARRRRSPAAFRRTVYRHNLWARPLPDFTGRFRDCTPEFYRYNEIQMNRLVPWLNRELHYLLNENIGHISYVMTRILELLPQYHINSPEFRDAMQRYFGDRTEHFLHELYCFASTPYDMTGYDRNVQYTTDTRISTMVNEVISSSESDSVDSDIVMVSSSEPAEPPPGPSRVPAPVYPQNYIPQPPANNVIPIETISQSDTDDDSSEVMVVGYIKPPQDRTPEVVDLLGSDSDVIVQDNAIPETSQSVEVQEPRQQPLVKLRLKRHTPQENGVSDSEDSEYRPPPPPRRKRRHRSNDTATTSDTCRTTPSPAHSTWSSNVSPPIASSNTGSSNAASRVSFTTGSSPASPFIDDSRFSDSSSTSSSSEPRRKRVKRKTKRKPRKDASPVDRHKKKSKKRSSSSHRKEKKSSPKVEERDKRSKRKSHSGKGVKSSKKSSEVAAAPVEAVAPQPEQDQPSTSGTNDTSRHRSSSDKKRRRTSRENKRLRSVVNVMYTRRNSGDSNISGNSNVVSTVHPNIRSGSQVDERTIQDQVSAEPTSTLNPSNTPWSESDSEDNIPLNLTVQKTYTSL